MADKIRFNNNDDIDDEYEPTDSEEEYSEEERELLANVRKRRQRPGVGDKNEVFGFADSDDTENDDDGEDVAELLHDSDIEGAEDNDDDLPNTMNWGKRKSDYYNTDFVDPDYSSYTAQEEELAKAEEEEAEKIQARLAAKLREDDFELDPITLPDDFDGDDDDAEHDESKNIKIKSDLSGLPKSDRLQLFYKDSPEFPGLIANFKKCLNEVEELIEPVIKYTRENNVPLIPALEFANVYGNILMTFCTNVTFYLLLKSKRLPVKTHPVVKRILEVQNLQEQLQDKYDNFIKPQLEALLERIENGDKFEVKPVQVKARIKRSKLRILDEFGEQKESEKTADASSGSESGDEDVEAANENDEEMVDKDEDARRGITYQIAKNKGLTPRRKKEQRNPRVKHREKYRKALIRRKGAVRTVRKEVQRYGGEISGIKATVSKSVKFKS